VLLFLKQEINKPPRFGSGVDGHVGCDAVECSLRLHVLSGDHEEKSAELCLAGTLHVGKGRLLIGGFTYFSVGTWWYNPIY